MSEQHPAELGSYATMKAETIFKNAQIQLSTWSEMVLDATESWSINFNFLGLNLAKIPSAGFSSLIKGDFSDLGTVLLLLIPILAAFTTWWSIKQTQKMSGQNQNNQTNAQANQMSNTMNIMMPLMTGFFSISLPSGMGLYWIASNLIQMVQQYILNKLLDNEEDDFVVKLPDKRRKNGKKHR